jgi:hypothetical protein
MLRPANFVRITYQKQPFYIIAVRAERDDPMALATAAEIGKASIPFFLGWGHHPTVFSMQKMVDLIAANEGGHFNQVAVQLCMTLGLTLHARAHCASLAAALRHGHRRPSDTPRVVILPVQSIDHQRLSAFMDTPLHLSHAA